MRVYLAMTLPALARIRAAGRIGPPPLAAHAVTGALREWYAESDLEELEHAAFTEASRSSLRALAADPAAPRLRVVLAADVPDATVRPVAGTEPELRSSVELSQEVPFDAVVSVHVDDAPASADVAAAVAALAAAERGDDDAQFVVDGAEGQELLWFDVTELDDVLAEGLGRG